jgi:DNA-binding transcriptional ArsR family regulator
VVASLRAGAPIASDPESDEVVGASRRMSRTSRSGGPETTALWAVETLADHAEPPGAVLLAGSVDLPNGQLARWQETRSTEWLLDADVRQVAEALAALGNPVRLRLLREVVNGKTTVQELAATDGIGATGQVYHHLRQLTAAGWVRRASNGRYEIPVARVVPLLGAILAART